MADVIFASEGVADLRVVEVDHPLGGIDADHLRQRIDTATALTLELLRDHR
jgi:hypothetical protein